MLRKAMGCIVLLSICLLAAPTPAQNALLNADNDPLSTESSFPQPLPAEEAFALTIQQLSDDHLLLLWDIADGYYLYRKSIGLEGIQARLIVPEGTLIEDEFFGKTAIFEQSLEVHIMLEPEQAIDRFMLSYQGCADGLYCYPMQFIELEI